MAREISAKGEVERMTLRIPVDDYEVLKRMSKIMPGHPSPAALIAQVVSESVPKWEQMLNGLDAMQSGNVQAGYDSIAAVAQLMESLGRVMSTDIAVAAPGVAELQAKIDADRGQHDA